MKVIAKNMEGSIASLGRYMKNAQDRYKKAVDSAKRRRMARNKYINRLMSRIEELFEKLEEVNTETQHYQDTENSKFYKSLMETFDAFDKDGSGEMQYPEYKAAWQFLKQPGSERDIKSAFDSVDIDNSGLVDRDEFVFSIMGPAANDFGPIADMDRMDALINGLMKLIESHRAELEELASTEQTSKIERETL